MTPTGCLTRSLTANMALRYETKINTTIPGLDVAFSKAGSSLYATVLHRPSGLIVMQFTGAPLPFGMREFVLRLDRSDLAKVNWDVPADKLDPLIDWRFAGRVKSQVLES